MLNRQQTARRLRQAHTREFQPYRSVTCGHENETNLQLHADHRADNLKMFSEPLLAPLDGTSQRLRTPILPLRITFGGFNPPNRPG